MDIQQLIKDVGFPIAAVVLCAWYIYKAETRAKDEAKEREEKQREDAKEVIKTLDKVADTIQESTEINRELSETNRLLVSGMKEELCSVGKNVEKILDKVERKGE